MVHPIYVCNIPLHCDEQKLLGAPDTWESGIKSTGLSQACRFVGWDGQMGWDARAYIDCGCGEYGFNQTLTNIWLHLWT